MNEQGQDEQGRARRHVLTNRQGHPVYDNQNNRTVGDRGPTVLENYLFLEKISHFDHGRIPERVVHARVAGAHGYFEASGRIGCDPASKYTRAKLFQENGKRTPVFIRFFTVIQGGHSPENLRDPRSSAVNTYKKVNAEGEAVLVKYQFCPMLGERIFPEWEMFVRVMSDDPHDELNFDPHDATKVWPEEQLPLFPVGRLVLDRNPVNYFSEVEQVAFGTGVLVDWLDFSDDKQEYGRRSAEGLGIQVSERLTAETAGAR